MVISVKSVRLISRGQVIRPLGKLLCSLMTFQHQTARLSPACSCSREGVCQKMTSPESFLPFSALTLNQETVRLAHRYRLQWHAH